MKHLQGNVKSIPVTEVKEGMQVLYDGRTCKVTSINHGTKDKPNYTPIILDGNFGITMDRLKTLVVEYLDDKYIAGTLFSSKMSQLPLKYSQWQSTIDAGEVDTDKIVEFEIIIQTSNGRGPLLDIAKIIPQKKRMYSEEEVKSLANKAYKYGFQGGVYENTDSWKKQHGVDSFDKWFELNK